MKFRVEHTFNFNDDDLDLARESYRDYGMPNESFRDYVKSRLISEGYSWLMSLADQGYGNE